MSCDWQLQVLFIFKLSGGVDRGLVNFWSVGQHFTSILNIYYVFFLKKTYESIIYHKWTFICVLCTLPRSQKDIVINKNVLENLSNAEMMWLFSSLCDLFSKSGSKLQWIAICNVGRSSTKSGLDSSGQDLVVVLRSTG